MRWFASLSTFQSLSLPLSLSPSLSLDLCLCLSLPLSQSLPLPLARSLSASRGVHVRRSTTRHVLGIGGLARVLVIPLRKFAARAPVSAFVFVSVSLSLSLFLSVSLSLALFLFISLSLSFPVSLPLLSVSVCARYARKGSFYDLAVQSATCLYVMVSTSVTCAIS